ncbi:MAG: hypothetical protein F6K28_44055 [Microcoleus sp. SIO2G3]|nr:hypothetical protein [Microcoleus sp. SIO2G3]
MPLPPEILDRLASLQEFLPQMDLRTLQRFNAETQQLIDRLISEQKSWHDRHNHTPDLAPNLANGKQAGDTTE